MPRVDSSGLASLYRENRTLVWLSIVIFVNQLGFGAVIPVVPLYAQSFGVSQTAIGFSIAVYGLARFLVNVPTGQLADGIGRQRTLVLGEVITMVGNLLCGMAGSFEQFLLFRFIAGAGASMVVTGGQVVLADISTPANRGRVMGIYQGMFLFAVGFGPLPGGLLAGWFGLNAPFFAFAALGGAGGRRGLRQGSRDQGASGAACDATQLAGADLRESRRPATDAVLSGRVRSG